MKKFTTSLMLALLSSTLIFCSGCQMLLFPLQMIFYLLGTVVTTFFSLIPVAAKCLPLLMLLARVEDDGSGTPANENAIMVCQSIETQQQTLAAQPLGDAQSLLTQTVQSTSANQDTQLVILSFDAWANPKQIESALREQTHGKTIVSLEYKLVDGTSLYNNKLSFFSLLDSLKNKGIIFKGFGTMQPTVDRFYDKSKA